ncbi:MAG: MFS transporter [Proteobacteria bacterium]|nr:MFS transporter [Pseudomonadota bacterium]
MKNFSAVETMPTPSYRRYLFALLFFLYLFDYMDRMVIVSLFPYLKADWGITDTQCGLLVSAVYWSILGFSFPVSILVDRWSRKKSIGLMAVLWSLATLACAFTRNFGQLFAARTAIGIGEAGYAPGGTAMISTVFPKEQRARILGLWNASIPLGSALGIAIGGLVAEHFGWRYALGIVALPGMAIALLFFTVKDYKTIALVKTVDQGQGKVQVKMRFADMARQFTHNPTLLFTNLGFAANVFVTTSLLTWLPTYFHRFEGLTMSRAGIKGGSVMLLAIIGAPLGGYLADLWMRRRPNARMVFPAVSSAITALFLFIAFAFFRGQIQYLILLAAGVFAVAFVPAAVAVTQDVVHPGLRATSLSVNVIIQHLLGSALGPLFIGALSDRFGLEFAMTQLPVFALVGCLLFWAGSKFYVKDLAAVEQTREALIEPAPQVSNLPKG